MPKNGVLENTKAAIPKYVKMVERGTAKRFAGKNQVGKVPKENKENGAVAIWATIEIIIGVRNNTKNLLPKPLIRSRIGRALNIPHTAAKESWKPISKIASGFIRSSKKAALDKILNGDTLLFKKSASDNNVNIQTALFTDGDNPVIAA